MPSTMRAYRSLALTVAGLNRFPRMGLMFISHHKVQFLVAGLDFSFAIIKAFPFAPSGSVMYLAERAFDSSHGVF